MHRTRIVIVASIALFAAACGSNETTPAGPVGKPVDFRAKLTPEVRQRAPTDDKATRKELAADVHGVKTKLVWRTFEDGGNKYVLSAAWEVVTPVRAITLEPIDTSDMLPTNRGTPDAVDEEVIVRIRWRDNSSSMSTKLGESSYTVRASGEAKPL